MFKKFSTRRAAMFSVAAAITAAGFFAPEPAQAQVTAFKQAVAQAAARDEAIATFYRENHYQPIWTGGDADDRDRLSELMRVLQAAGSHGLPVSRYDPERLMATLRNIRSTRDRGLAEVELTKVFLKYARDVQTGIIANPKRLDAGIVREIPVRDSAGHLKGIADGKPAAFFRALPPTSMEYNSLIREKVEMEALLARGGWGPTVSARKLEPGNKGAAVVALRNRLMAMGYLGRSNTMVYDAAITEAVQQFQVAHGLNDDGKAGVATMAQINVGVEQRLQSVMVALERERWFNTERGKRHILVNIPDFTAKIIDDGKVTFQTRSVVGARDPDRVTPEFSDVMSHMVVNPSWFVPRSIATKEYLPSMQRNPNAAGHLVLTDRRGRTVSRSAINFNRYNARNFPFNMRQPPSRSNALGLVKFMFPNKYNIYLHDTPAKNLFGRDVRAFSHGCVRLAQPFEFAYALLAVQEDDPVGKFQSILRSGQETRVNLDQKVPVHLIYRTAVTNARGHTEYRADIYGRDAKIWNALSKAGVVLSGYRG